MFKTALYLFALALIVKADEHFIDDCLNSGKNPIVLYNQEVSKDGHIFQIQEQNIRIPLTGFSESPITCITVVNLLSDLDGGYPYIKAGGVNYTYVDLYLKSQKRKGFDFRITVYYDKSQNSNVSYV
ncbi:unnamed protein product [Ceutorhynchus assimilis]|uniref:Uncharacterized protein n=1 Tax=Ceutorhynchus assimilis TaxID=467358 RepID=A0A9N9MPT7_9CUCU|nr:unnamed protein product [Ceutorhynchus assimilis]